ncbi:hypothetical protein GC163_19125 [bacterium]|nr:hypothetical protein [bacterium]
MTNLAELTTKDTLLTVGVAMLAGMFTVPLTARVVYDWWQQGLTPLVTNQLVYMTIWNLWFLGLPLFKVGLVWWQGAYEHGVPAAILCRIYCRYQLFALVPIAFALIAMGVGLLPLVIINFL